MCVCVSSSRMGKRLYKNVDKTPMFSASSSFFVFFFSSSLQLTLMRRRKSTCQHCSLTYCILYVIGLFTNIIAIAFRVILQPLPYSLRYYIFATYVTVRGLAIWAISIGIKLKNKVRGPSVNDLLIPLQAAETVASLTASAISLPLEMAGVSVPSKRNRVGTSVNVADMVTQENDCPFVLVHGVFGWGDTFWMPSYWAGAEMLDRKVLMTSLGPLSSHHDRACELFYQLKGGVVDYGEKHSKKCKHRRYGRKYRAKYPEWSSRKPLHFIGHSMGGGTVRYLQHLLDRRFFPGYPDTSANWICSLSCVSSPHNGTLFCDFLGLAEDNRSVRMGSLLHVAIACVSLAHWFGLLKLFSIDFRIEHFRFREMSFRKLLRAVFFAEHPLVQHGDWCCSDLSVKGAMRLNKMGSFKSTYVVPFSSVILFLSHTRTHVCPRTDITSLTSHGKQSEDS